MPIAAVTELWRYPVKSLQGERVESIDLGDAVPHDRAWGIVDVATGHLLSAKTVPELLFGAAAVVSGRCQITLSDGTVTNDTRPDVDEALSDWLHRRVHLATPEADARASISIEWDEGQDDPGELPVFDFETQAGSFLDSSSALHLVSTGTLAHMATEVGPEAGDVRRYRPNIVVELDGAFVEEQWVDATLALGSATAWVKKPTDRCVVITRAYPGADASRDAIRHLARANGRNLGVSAQPRSPGRIDVGDVVAPL